MLRAWAWNSLVWGFRVSGSGLRDWGVGWGVGFRVEDLGFRGEDLGFRVEDL